ncbi:hypothetical protein [Janthinobacterium sp. HH01]|uniref:hypothetical protein n=1 Tax=Janthinobacterium sp. HH01 TaxID=1198452 RepID=UPI001268D9EC|nr:hypothetical protein [Janthinobacterium sp. HH01]
MERIQRRKVQHFIRDSRQEHCKMEERIARLEAISDSTVAAVAALRTDMNDRFKLVDVQLAELRRQKVETDVILGRLDAQAAQIADLRQYIDDRFELARAETNLRFDQIDLRFVKVDQRFLQVDQRFDQVDQRFVQVDQRFAQVDQRFAQVDKRFDQVDRTLEEHAYQIKELRSEFKDLRSEFRYVTRWIIGIQFTTLLFLVGLALKTF